MNSEPRWMGGNSWDIYRPYTKQELNNYVVGATLSKIGEQCSTVVIDGPLAEETYPTVLLGSGIRINAEDLMTQYVSMPYARTLGVQTITCNKKDVG